MCVPWAKSKKFCWRFYHSLFFLFCEGIIVFCAYVYHYSDSIWSNVPGRLFKKGPTMSQWDVPFDCFEINGIQSDQLISPRMPFIYPQEMNMYPEKRPFEKEISSSNHQFSKDILVFRGSKWIISPGKGKNSFFLAPPSFFKWLTI